ncbi:MAG TPA: CHASE2 domain-containing protein, partial [Phycisphaerae bacterium]|nr:CHASE2 domain-containing protein [Phycisphaerae bacterium]
MVRVLHELDAESIVLDLVFSESRPPELRLPEFTRFASIEGRTERIGQISAENEVFPDDELAAAIRESRNVYLAMFYKPEPALTPAERRAVELFSAEVEMTADEAARRLGCSLREFDGLAPFRLRRLAIEHRVAGCLATRPAASAREVHDALRTAPFDVYDPIREAVLWSYMRVRSAQEVEQRSPPVPPGLAGRLPVVSNLTPPLFRFTRGAKGEGFVCFEPDADGTLRHLPLMVECHGRLLKQLAFAVLCDTLGIRDDDMAIDRAGILTIRAAGDRPRMRVQLDSEGRMLLNWNRAGPSWASSFTHVSAAKILEICDLRRRSRENETARQIHLARAIRLVKDDAAFEAYRQDVDRYLADRRELHWAELEGRAAMPEVVALRSRVEEQSRRIEADQTAVIQLIHETWDELKGLDPADPAIAAEYRRFREAHEILAETCPRLEAANAGIEARVRSLRAALRPLLAGRICLVGYTATAVADMVDTPAFTRLPGVMVHSNLLNTFLQRSFYRWSRPWERALIVLAAGALVTVLSASRGPRVSFALVVLTMLALAAANLMAMASGLRFWLAGFLGVGVAFV